MLLSKVTYTLIYVINAINRYTQKFFSLSKMDFIKCLYFFYCTYLSNAECIACKADNVHILVNKNIIFNGKCQICSIFNIWKYNKR